MSSQSLTSDEIRRAQELVSRIQGVSSCRISVDPSGSITEVHVVATSNKSARLIARDVESCLKADMGIDVNYKKIGVVMFDPTDQTAASDPPAVEESETELEEFPIEEYASRFSFGSVNLFLSALDTRAEVELSRDGSSFFGSAAGHSRPDGSSSLVAQATLSALSESLDDPIRLCLGEVRKVSIGDKDAVLVRVDLVEQREIRVLVGCSVITGDENQTVVFATLDAVNRVVGKLRFKASVEYRIR